MRLILLIIFAITAFKASPQSIENKLWVCVAKSVNGKFSVSEQCKYFTLKLTSSNKTFEQRRDNLKQGNYELSSDKKKLTLKSTPQQIYYIEQKGDMVLFTDQSAVNEIRTKFYLFPK